MDPLVSGPQTYAPTALTTTAPSTLIGSITPSAGPQEGTADHPLPTWTYVRSEGHHHTLLRVQDVLVQCLGDGVLVHECLDDVHAGAACPSIERAIVPLMLRSARARPGGARARRRAAPAAPAYTR